MQLVTRKATYSIHVTGGTTFSLYTVSYSYSPNIPIVVFSMPLPGVEYGTYRWKTSIFQSADQLRFLDDRLPTPPLSQNYHLLLPQGKIVTYGKGYSVRNTGLGHAQAASVNYLYDM